MSCESLGPVEILEKANNMVENQEAEMTKTVENVTAESQRVMEDICDIQIKFKKLESDKDVRRMMCTM